MPDADNRYMCCCGVFHSKCGVLAFALIGVLIGAAIATATALTYYTFDKDKRPMLRWEDFITPAAILLVFGVLLLARLCKSKPLLWVYFPLQIAFVILVIAIAVLRTRSVAIMNVDIDFIDADDKQKAYDVELYKQIINISMNIWVTLLCFWVFYNVIKYYRYLSKNSE